ncbi:MAG: hypothetical protein A4S17_11690 [Proteobacteria bacterium HN_bin10]|nr:MAG: hypothetical protein A4S17_11690 [Proteobacteria bacterium HN_bin10]
MTLASDFKWTAKRAALNVLRHLPDRVALSIDYFRVFGRLPNLRTPRRFSEKMQHMKLAARDPTMPTIVDKICVKEFVRQTLGDEWLIPTIWHGDEVTEAILGEIPKPAVMKPNHSSAHVRFLSGETNLGEAARAANDWLTYDHHVLHREWAYGQIKRQILIEPLIANGGPLNDYKFWVFDGAVRFVQVDLERFQKHRRQFYNPQWERLDFALKYPSAPDDIPAPKHLSRMLAAAETLAAGFRFLRVDLYDTPDRPLFGELTLAPEAGLCRFSPDRIDLELGEAWSYPAASQGGGAQPVSFTMRAGT